MTEWREDLKGVLYTAGRDNKQVTFLFVDTQIVMESFMEDINNLLNAGEVPNLFELARQKICSTLDCNESAALHDSNFS